MNESVDHPGRFIMIPFWLLKARKIRLTAKIVYRYLVFKQANRGYWEGWITQISNETGIPRRSITRDLAQLSAIGYISIERHLRRGPNGKLRTFSQYRILK